MSKITINVPEITIGIDLGNKKHDICVLNTTLGRLESYCSDSNAA